ncbi:MAG TPA: cyclic nucleotide-binding domain-containing protein [Burkholderiales bacterium]|nr:cyclic nucleotide-binding domain-containing protein [Burkholderiales bacterium]
MDDLDFSKPAKSAPQAPAAAPAYQPAVARAFFESAGRAETVAAGTRFFAENEKASRLLLKRDKMYLLLRGEVALLARGQPIGRVRPGEVFGEMAAISESPRSATAQAQTACEVISLDEKQFQGALRQKPEFALMLLGIMIARLRAMLARLSETASLPAALKETRVFDKPLLAALDKGLGEAARVRYERGKVIMVQGQTGAFMYVVMEGRVAISLRGATVERVGPGGVFGEMALVDQSARAANAAADTDCILLAINRPVFLNLVRTDPIFGVSLLGAVAARVRSLAAAS